MGELCGILPWCVLRRFLSQRSEGVRNGVSEEQAQVRSA
jgi:hypothetical protein